MKRLLPSLALLVAATTAAADDFSARGQLSYQSIKTTNVLTSGFRQQYDLRLDKALTGTSRFRIFCRADDFRGTSEFSTGPQESRSRQLQPAGEFLVNTSNVRAQARSEYFKIRSQTGSGRSDRTLERTSGHLEWAPDSLPRLEVLGQRNATRDSAATVNLKEQSAIGTLSYEWRGLHGSVREQLSSADDPVSAYDRKSMMHAADLGYAMTGLGGRLTASAEGSTQLLSMDERATGAGPTSIPTPVPIARALYSVDETPLDGSDRPPVLNTLLTDNDTNTSSGISLGPDAPSFQNFVIDLGRIDRVDEVRVVVRNERGDPLQHGGGPVTFDVYTSQDGVVWTGIGSETTYNDALSLYSVTFTQTNGRWFKVVNFGVNAETTLVSELAAYYHTTIAAGGRRKGDQSLYAGTANVSYQPVQRLTLMYSGFYSTARQELTGLPRVTTSDLEHLATVQVDLVRAFSLRTQLEKRDTRSQTGNLNSARGVTAYLDYKPTPQLTSTLEVGRENQTLDGTAFVLQTLALHNNAQVLRSVLVTLDLGAQKQSISTDETTAERRFATLTAFMQLSRTWRLLLNGSLQRTTTDSLNPAVQILGAEKDERISAEFVWRPGRPLQLSARYGYVSGIALSGFTQRYHADWFPFGDGTVSIGVSLDQDIDPMFDRRATRAIFTPRWIMNRWASIDVNYTSVRSTLGTTTNRDRTLYATLTLTR